jgi:hypothetical protein
MRKTIPIVIILLVSLATESRSQKPLLSPRDSVQITYNGNRIFIDYGRPSIRGRVIMGGLVPYNEWWRTGANEATSFKIDSDLLVADSLVPAGEYTLYTLPSEKQWKLIINRQTGQWGTVYNRNLDLFRLPMAKRTLRDTVQMFTIDLNRSGSSSGILRLRWETTEVEVPFKVLGPRHQPTLREKQ